MKIKLVNTAAGLFPAMDEDYEKKIKLKLNEVYEVEIRQVRNYEFHKKYFSLINTAWEYLNETQQQVFGNNKDKFRKSVEITAGHFEPVYSIEKKSYEHHAKSISFSKMDEFEFRELYNSVRHVLFNHVLSVSAEEFERNLINY